MEITKREIIASISIVAIMLLLGVIIAGKISDTIADDQAKYNKATQITSQELFQYGMDTNIGNAFVYGVLQAVDPVTYPDVERPCLSITKERQEYRSHTRTVTHTDGKGHSYTTTETYWSWDTMSREHKVAKEVTFCKVQFKYSQFNEQKESYISTVSGGYHVRYVYDGCPARLTGTIFAFLTDGGFDKNGATFYRDMDIEQTLKRLNSKFGLVIFWILWIILIGGAVYGFYYLDNNWLEDKRNN